ncbi:DnaJ domain [Musa troglodytarum]|uniref:DnaJ domain n=1 Tax=Musa troglodytarum TaxID=320322 RepID=A0A9E7KKC0_9LILI|nr:DnaJ domain [Musa troglodytarum]
MWWDEEFREEEEEEEAEEEEQRESPVDFDFFSLLSKPKKWHPDKKKEESATSRFQEINEAYKEGGTNQETKRWTNKALCSLAAALRTSESYLIVTRFCF